jgi:hypothetical protein
MSSHAEPLSVASAERHSRLATRVRTLRTHAGTGQLDRWLLIIGGVLIPLGVLLIAMGWLGASRTVLVFEQIPYLISGGLLGLGLVFMGGFVYFAYWQTQLVRDTRAERRELVDALQRIERLLAGGAFIAANGELPAYDETQLVATENGSMIHRVDCPVVLNRENLRYVDSDEPGLRPCSICEPFAEQAEHGAEAGTENVTV